MCGIAGFWNGDGIGRDAARVLRAMTDAISHRGPDDCGAWLDDGAGLALGHRRLSIIDLSPTGHQPMASNSGRFVTIFNGEVYNYRSLRAELEALAAAPAWRGHSDTEVMLAALDCWGVLPTLKRINGMFALAIWDRQTRTLTLARDRLGEKPLYYGRMNGSFLFGSELKALTAHPGFLRSVDREALTLFLRYNCIPSPYSIWAGVSKLPAAHFVEIRDGGRTMGKPTAYWDFRAVAESGASDPLPDSPQTVNDLEALLADAVGRRMEADVPLGALLSGGIDSSLVVSLMQTQSTRPVETFTVEPSRGRWPQASRLTDDLVAAVNGTLSLTDRLAERARAYRTEKRPVAPQHVATEISVDNAASASATVIEVRAEDVVGQLHRITQALFDCGLDVISAKVNTFGAAVVDAFYVRGPDGEKVTESHLLNAVDNAVRAGVAAQANL